MEVNENIEENERELNPIKTLISNPKNIHTAFPPLHTTLYTVRDQKWINHSFLNFTHNNFFFPQKKNE